MGSEVSVMMYDALMLDLSRSDNIDQTGGEAVGTLPPISGFIPVRGFIRCDELIAYYMKDGESVLYSCVFAIPSSVGQDAVAPEQKVQAISNNLTEILKANPNVSPEPIDIAAPAMAPERVIISWDDETDDYLSRPNPGPAPTMKEELQKLFERLNRRRGHLKVLPPGIKDQRMPNFDRHVTPPGNHSQINRSNIEPDERNRRHR